MVAIDYEELFKMREITKQNALEVHAKTPRRKCFADHSGVQKRKVRPTFSVPAEGISKIFEAQTGLSLSYSSQMDNYWCFLSPEQIEQVEAWERAQGKTIYLRDCLSVSGNAAGVDFEAHYNSLKSGGKTIFVLPEGINHFRIKKAFEPVWNWENTLVISQFEPDEIWQSFRAMTRNQLIIALSRVMIVIEAGEKGGTLNAGMETLKSGLPLFVAEYQDMSEDAKGNKILLDKGAHKLAKSRSTNRANLTKVIEKMSEDGVIQRATQQGSLL